MIVCIAGFRGGRPHVSGTGVTVDRIATMHTVDGMAPEAISDDMDLSLAQVHAAIAFYLANRPAIDEWLATQDAEHSAVAREYYAGRGSSS